MRRRLIIPLIAWLSLLVLSVLERQDLDGSVAAGQAADRPTTVA
jgi:hypothetical protein